MSRRKQVQPVQQPAPANKRGRKPTKTVLGPAPKAALFAAPIEFEPMLTIVDVEHILGVSKPKIYELMRTHGLPSFKLDGARRFHASDIKNWIEQQKQAS